ncbi:hypothetical protein D9M73_225460 [compost metagenome]
MGLVTEGGAVDRLHHRSRADQGVLAQVHGRRAGMGFDAAQSQVEPLLTQGAKDHADGLGLVFKNRPLLDMRFEIRPHRVPRHGTRTGVANGVQRFANADTLGIALGQGVFQGELAGEHP